jgi:arylsulfatase A-like enzyme
MEETGMTLDKNINRREFIDCLGAGALLAAAGLGQRPALGAANTAPWTPPPVLKNPNILVIMVDQLRPPVWMSQSQLAALTQVLPNIMGRLRSHSYNFGQVFAAATMCTPSRACLLTGLYAPQTAMYATDEKGAGGASPSLDSEFPTWGEALATLNLAYQGNVWWFGKWHLSQHLNKAPLLPYGFQTGTYPGGSSSPYNPSPNGYANEGTDGGLFNQLIYANDAMIANDFVGWLQGQPAAPAAPWCATVSFVNPHDITWAPAWLQASPFPPTGVTPQSIYFPPPNGSPPSFYTAAPSPWNYETLTQVPNKPAVQLARLNSLNQKDGVVTDWVLFLNQYLWLQSLVDQQVGAVLDALASSAFAANTIVVFLSDHGEFGGSHGMHAKGYAVYDESIRVPFYVQFPGQTAHIAMHQMCSTVDFFGLICDLGTGGGGAWTAAYPDLAGRQSIWSFLYNNSSESRITPAPVGLPFVLHTCDEGGGTMPKPHITCLRTKLDLNAGAVGAKLAFYTDWAPCTTYPDSTPPDNEFYDYNPQTTNNTAETGNDYYSNNATTQATIAQYQQVLGSWGPPGTGLIASELNRPLIGVGTHGKPLSQTQAAARQAYFTFLYGSTGCP